LPDQILAPPLTILVVATRQPAGTRAKDSDRDDTCQVLDHALSDGPGCRPDRDPRLDELRQQRNLTVDPQGNVINQYPPS